MYNLKLLRLYDYLCRQDGINCTIVHSLDGYDEISLTSDFKVASPQGEKIYSPADLGFPTYAQRELWGGQTVEEAAQLFHKVLDGTAPSAARNCVTANAAFAIRTLVPDMPLEEALAKARESLESGRAMERFRRFVRENS